MCAVLLLALPGFALSVARADERIYMLTDENGVVHLTNIPDADPRYKPWDGTASAQQLSNSSARIRDAAPAHEEEVPVASDDDIERSDVDTAPADRNPTQHSPPSRER